MSYFTNTEHIGSLGLYFSLRQYFCESFNSKFHEKKMSAALSEDYKFKMLYQYDIWIISVEKVLSYFKWLIKAVFIYNSHL